MANVESLQEKFNNASEKVEKCRATIERHEKQLAKKLVEAGKLGVTLDNLEAKREEFRGKEEHWDDNWKLYDVERKLDDIKGAKKKLAEAISVMDRWEEKLNLEREKERMIKDDIPQVMKDFLDQWKTRAYEWHVKRYEAYLIFRAELNAKVKKADEELEAEGYRWREKDKKLAEMGLDYKSVEAKKYNYAGEVVLKMVTYRNETERLSYLEALLEADRKAKLLDLVNRINHVIGSIENASGLRIDGKGCLNGIVSGPKGTAKVETIGAGGWNIQCWHYRTLVHKLKEKVS